MTQVIIQDLSHYLRHIFHKFLILSFISRIVLAGEIRDSFKDYYFCVIQLTYVCDWCGLHVTDIYIILSQQFTILFENEGFVPGGNRHVSRN